MPQPNAAFAGRRLWKLTLSLVGNHFTNLSDIDSWNNICACLSWLGLCVLFYTRHTDICTKNYDCYFIQFIFVMFYHGVGTFLTCHILKLYRHRHSLSTDIEILSVWICATSNKITDISEYLFTTRIQFDGYNIYWIQYCETRYCSLMVFPNKETFGYNNS